MLEHGHSSWTTYLKKGGYTPVNETLIDGRSCPSPSPPYVANPHFNAGRSGGVFLSDPTCSSPGAMGAVERACLGEESCALPADNATRFGGVPCAGSPKGWRLTAKVLCAAAPRVVSGGAAYHSPPPRMMVNGDGECYGNSGLGVAMGVMRDPMSGLRPPPDFDQQFGWDLNATGRHVKRRTDEAERAARWQRIAPAFGAMEPGGAEFAVDGDSTLVDSWTFRPGETWYAGYVGRAVSQAAPARMARGAVPLPEVVTTARTAPPPFLLACAYPTGAVSVTALGRVQPWPVGYVVPRANVTQHVPVNMTDRDAKRGAAQLPLVGVFGRFAALTLVFDPAPAAAPSCTVLAQDLIADSATDITALATLKAAPGAGGSLSVMLPGAVIDQIGTAGRSRAADLSDPGLVIRVTCV